MRRDNALYTSHALKELLELMIIEMASPVILKSFVRGKMQALLMGEVPISDLVMSVNISKPLDQYTRLDKKTGLQIKNDLAQVRVAEELIAAGFPVEPGDRIDMVYIGTYGKKVADRAKAFKLYKEEQDPLDFEFYADKLQGPLERALHAVLTEKELKELFSHKTYKRMVPSATAMAGQDPNKIVRYFHVEKKSKYNIKGPKEKHLIDEEF